MKPLMIGLLLVGLSCLPVAAAWSETTPDLFGGGCQSTTAGVGGPPGPYARLNGDCTATVGCDDLIADLCE